IRILARPRCRLILCHTLLPSRRTTPYYTRANATHPAFRRTGLMSARPRSRRGGDESLDQGIDVRDRRTDHDRLGSCREGLGSDRGGGYPSLADRETGEPAECTDEFERRETGASGLRRVTAQRRRTDRGPGRRRFACVLHLRAVRHRDAPDSLDLRDDRADRRAVGSRPPSGIESDQIGARGDDPLDVGDPRGDVRLEPRDVNLDQADHRDTDGGPHRGDPLLALDTNGDGTVRLGAAREGGDDLGRIEDRSGRRLNRDDQTVAQRFEHRDYRGANAIASRSAPTAGSASGATGSSSASARSTRSVAARSGPSTSAPPHNATRTWEGKSSAWRTQRTSRERAIAP